MGLILCADDFDDNEHQPRDLRSQSATKVHSQRAWIDIYLSRFFIIMSSQEQQKVADETITNASPVLRDLNWDVSWLVFVGRWSLQSFAVP